MRAKMSEVGEAHVFRVISAARSMSSLFNLASNASRPKSLNWIIYKLNQYMANTKRWLFGNQNAKKLMTKVRYVYQRQQLMERISNLNAVKIQFATNHWRKIFADAPFRRKFLSWRGWSGRRWWATCRSRESCRIGRKVDRAHQKSGQNENKFKFNF